MYFDKNGKFKVLNMVLLDKFSFNELDEFLEKNQDGLHEHMVSKSLDRLDSYLANSENSPLYLGLGLCAIQLEGTKEGFIALELLTTVLENQFKNRTEIERGY